MDISFLLAATEAAAEAAGEHAGEEEHKSELPFFVLGGLLATFAIVISVVGFKKPDFPGTAGAARGVMLVSVALVVAAMASTVYVST